MERRVKERRIREGESLWRVYMKSYAESRRSEPEQEQEDASERRKTPVDIPRLPHAAAVDEMLPPRQCFPLGGLRLGRRAAAGTPVGPTRGEMRSIWRSVRSRQSASLPGRRGRLSSRSGSEEWPGVWPCTKRDLLGELREKEKRRKRRDAFPCDSRLDEEEELLLRQHGSDLANRKELGHVRAPVPCPEAKSDFMVDRAAGERPGLVDGDYVVLELAAENSQGKRAHANVVLRGLKGMHLPELSPLRARRATWKFCFYQALVALLAKTQLRYKYAWGANIDYIYDHAWTLFTHIGALNVRRKQRFDDVVVYNYKYSVELELVHEMKDAPVARGVDWGYEENGLKRRVMLPRKDPLKVRVELGCRKVTESTGVPVHEDARAVEQWFDQLAWRYRNCILRTSRFSLAFWQDGLFWYLYNPYRCDEFGLWDDDGRGCIVKFCSKDSLRRHLVLLSLRAFAYEVPRSVRADEHVFDLQIFHVTFLCCQLHNLKLLQRGAAPKAPRQPRVGEVRSSFFETSDGDEAERESEMDVDEDPRAARERVAWLKRFRATWSKCPAGSGQKRRAAKVVAGDSGKKRWHHYHVEEANRLFSLWGSVHVSDGMFDEANRGMQTYACYVVCAGMTRLMAPEYWSPKVLDVVVMCGDRYYTRSRLEAERKVGSSEYARVDCWSKYLSERFDIAGTIFEARMLPALDGRLYAKSDKCLWRSLERMFAEHPFAVLTCESVCLGLFKFCGAYYMCDVGSFGPPLFTYGHGVPYLMRATSFRKFATVLVASIGSPDRSRFTLNPVEILKVVEVGAEFARRTTRRPVHKRVVGKAKRRA
ncbi:uncharacterized protein LOC105183045 [Harpegnathos saltator]|nr:uncharacterized protein LOC105183045 [Harpegnathos saltator]